MFGRVTTPPLRTRPAFPGAPPPLRRDVPCHRNPVPDVNGPSSIGPPDGSRASAPLTPVPRPATATRLMPTSSLGGSR
jgi:hypothetical protein